MSQRRENPAPSRRPRADAERNRARLLAEANRVFGEKGAAASLEEIARAAGVGIGTLYRHFPTRDALVSEVYRHEIDELAKAADARIDADDPVEALREWMQLFAEHLANKHGGLHELLVALDGGPSSLYAASTQATIGSMTRLTDRAVASGRITMDMDPLDLLRAVAGVIGMQPSPNWRMGARRMIDVLLAGLATSHGDEKPKKTKKKG